MPSAHHPHATRRRAVAHPSGQHAVASALTRTKPHSAPARSGKGHNIAHQPGRGYRSGFDRREPLQAQPHRRQLKRRSSARLVPAPTTATMSRRPSVILLAILLGGPLGARACAIDWDCSLGGSCGAERRCKCDPGWQGPTCAEVAFGSAPSVGHAFRPGPGFTTWGGSPIQADNRSMYYLFASVQVNGTLATYPNTSVIVTAVSSSPAGPYHWDRVTVTIKARRPPGVWDQRAVTNPVVVRLRRGAGFVLYYVEQHSNTSDPYGTTGYSAIKAAFSTRCIPAAAPACCAAC